MTPEEIEQLDRSLEPLRKEAYEKGFEYGRLQGVLNVYVGLLNRIGEAANAMEAKAEADQTKTVREWMRKTWPHINEYFNRK